MQKLEYSSNLYYAVIIAEMVGFLGAHDLIDYCDLNELTDTICDLVNEYNELPIDSPPVDEWSRQRLREIYGRHCN